MLSLIPHGSLILSSNIGKPSFVWATITAVLSVSSISWHWVWDKKRWSVLGRRVRNGAASRHRTQRPAGNTSADLLYYLYIQLRNTVVVVHKQVPPPSPRPRSQGCNTLVQLWPENIIRVHHYEDLADPFQIEKKGILGIWQRISGLEFHTLTRNFDDIVVRSRWGAWSPWLTRNRPDDIISRRHQQTAQFRSLAVFCFSFWTSVEVITQQLWNIFTAAAQRETLCLFISADNVFMMLYASYKSCFATWHAHCCTLLQKWKYRNSMSSCD